MPPPTYPLAPTALGEARAYEVAELALGPAWNHAATTDLLQVSLAPNPVTGGWFVRTRHGALGQLDATVREEYPQLQRVHRSGMEPVTIAQLSRLGDGLLAMDVLLPAPPFAVPRNNLPAAARLLPQGEGLLLDVSTADGVSAEEIADISPDQLLVTLSSVAGEVVAVYDNRPVGVVPAARTPLGFAGQVAARQQAGAPLAARAFCGDGLIAVDIAAELVDAAQPLPALSEPPPQPYQPIDLSADWEAFIDAAEVSLDPPRGPRPVAGP